jgi:hypothetical protein
MERQPKLENTTGRRKLKDNSEIFSINFEEY